VPGGGLPWREVPTEEEVVDENEPEQLEVLIDEIMREEQHETLLHEPAAAAVSRRMRYADP
jgi:hypothetical protein